MKKYNPKIKLYEMANLSKSKTGLDYIIWIMPKTGKEKHWARIKVKVNNEFIPVSISDAPKVMSKLQIPQFKLNKIKKWVVLNKQVLLDYWNGEGEIGVDEIINRFKKL